MEIKSSESDNAFINFYCLLPEISVQIEKTPSAFVNISEGC